MIRSFQATDSLVAELYKQYQSYEVTAPQYAMYAFDLGNYKIVVYNSLKVVFNGRYEAAELAKWLDMLPFYKGNIIGSDEVGTGDYFGPIVVCAAYVSDANLSKLKTLNIMDSKNLSDAAIVSLAKELITFIDYQIVVITNLKYNQLYESGYNIKQILAIAHHKAITNLALKVDVVIDQFVPKQTFDKYVNKQTNYLFETKAESKYVCVSVASIIARAKFVSLMTEMELEIKSQYVKDFKLIYGAGHLVDIQANLLYNVIKDEKFKNYVKYNFKNTIRVKEQQNEK